MKKSFIISAIFICFCFLNNPSYTQSPGWIWAKSAGSNQFDYSVSVAVDRFGNSYVTGGFTDMITFGTETLTAGGTGEFVVKYDAGGNVLWARSGDSPANDGVCSVAVDPVGNVYMSGYLAGTYIVFDTVTLLNGGHFAAFITKYDAGGNVLWARAGWTQPSAFGPTTTEMSGVVADSSGNLYGTGSFESSTLTLGSHVLHNKGDFDLFLVKYDPDGNVLWAKSAGGTRSDFSVSVARDRSGNILTAGYYSSPVLILGTDTLKCPEPSSSNTLLVKYDTTGKILWARSGGTTGIQRGEAVATDTSGNVYMTGVFESPTIIFGSDTLTNASDEFDIFLVKYDAGGNVLWARSAGSTSWDNATSVAVDASGNPYVTGSFESSRLIIGADTLYNPGVTSIFLAKYDYNGNVLWAKSAGFSLNDAAASVAADRSGNVFITGSFSSPKLIFGADTLINTNYDIMYGYCDMFLAKAGSNTGFAELRNSPGISVFPNPATDKIIIETSATPVNSQLSIINLNAQELITQKISERKTVIRISNLPNGIYFIRLTNDQSVDIGKFIKQ